MFLCDPCKGYKRQRVGFAGQMPRSLLVSGQAKITIGGKQHAVHLTLARAQRQILRGGNVRAETTACFQFEEVGPGTTWSVAASACLIAITFSLLR
ncbi:hypothetical protein D3C71_1011490 [compost metagenome]